jgi:hypothetical protein
MSGNIRHFAGLVLSAVLLAGCGSPGVPDPIKVLENPTTGARARFFREIPYKVPANYDEKTHLAGWTAEQKKAGFSKEISPAADREALAKLRKTNLAASRAAAN